MLSVDDLDLLIVEEFGKNISRTGLDMNVIGQQLYHKQPELTASNGPGSTSDQLRPSLTGTLWAWVWNYFC